MIRRELRGRQLRCVASLVAVVSLAAVAAWSTAAAQYSRQPIVLVHGFNASGDDWGGTEEKFQQELYANFYSWTLGWDWPFAHQVGVLRNQMQAAQLPDTSILIAHSFGGLISRELTRTQKVKGILTIGTPHGGAPIAGSVLDLVPTVYGALITTTAATAFSDYYNLGSVDPFCGLQGETEPSCDGEIAFALASATAAGLVGTAVTAIPGLFAGDAYAHGGGSLQDADPHSSFILALNSNDNLNREASTISQRVSLSGRYTGWASPIWAISQPDAAPYFTGITEAAIAEMLYAANYYDYYTLTDDPYYWTKTSYWQDWLWAGLALAGLDQAWCVWTGMVSIDGQCVEGDGLFSMSAQKWNAPNTVYDEVTGPSHTAEKANTDFQKKAYYYLVYNFLVKTGPPQGATPPSVWISGPLPSAPGNYTYSAVASGGNGSYTYHWQMSSDGSYYWDTSITDSQLSVYLDYGNNIWLRVTVTSNGLQATADRYVPGPSQCGLVIC
jgi:pimeloyl-ACP methyl ester carboxylesterase